MRSTTATRHGARKVLRSSVRVGLRSSIAQSQRDHGPSGNPIGAQRQGDCDVGRHGCECDPQRCVVEHTGLGNGDRHQQQGDADSDQVRGHDQDGQDDLDAYPATLSAFRHPSEQQGTVRRGLRQPTALAGHRLEHPAQALRHGHVGRHGGVGLICRSRSKVNRVRLVIARCTVDYVGRLTAHLPSARRLLLFKADGSVSVHADDRAYKPLNWMSPPCWLTQDPGGEAPVWVVENKAGEQLRITVE